MDEEIRDLLDDEIKSEIIELSSLSPGSQEKSTAIKGVAELYKLRVDENKNEWDFSEKEEKRRMEADQKYSDLDIRANEEQLKRDQLKEQIKDRYFRVGTAIAEIVLPLIFYAFWMKRGFIFEETGTFTSSTFKNLFNRFRPTK